MIVDNVLAIRRGLTADQSKDEDDGEVKEIKGAVQETDPGSQDQEQAQTRAVNGEQANNVAVSARVGVFFP